MHHAFAGISGLTGLTTSAAPSPSSVRYDLLSSIPVSEAHSKLRLHNAADCRCSFQEPTETLLSVTSNISVMFGKIVVRSLERLHDEREQKIESIITFEPLRAADRRSVETGSHEGYLRVE